MTFIHQVRKAAKRGLNAVRAFDRALRSVSPRQLADSIAKCEIAHGDTVLAHASMQGMEYFRGDPKDALDALLSVIGPEGTLVMPAFSFSGRSYDYLLTNPAFDLMRTPAKTGIVAELLRRKKGSIRSLHPTHSVVALGPQSERLTAGHANSKTPFDEHSPWARLLEINAWMLCMGTDPELLPVTPYHHFDELMAAELQVRIYHETQFRTTVRDAQGHQRDFPTYAHDPETGRFRDYDRLCVRQIRMGVLKHWRAGKINLWAGRMQPLFGSVQELARSGLTAYSRDGICEMHNAAAFTRTAADLPSSRNA